MYSLYNRGVSGRCRIGPDTSKDGIGISTGQMNELQFALSCNLNILSRIILFQQFAMNTASHANHDTPRNKSPAMRRSRHSHFDMSRGPNLCCLDWRKGNDTILQISLLSGYILRSMQIAYYIPELRNHTALASAIRFAPSQTSLESRTPNERTVPRLRAPDTQPTSSSH
jgi:hypothetical protein